MFWKKKSTANKFKLILSTSDWMSANAVCQAGQYNKVGEYIVPPQQQIAFGSNDPIGGGSVAGTACYIRLDNESGTQIHGKIRLVLSNARQTRQEVVIEDNTRRFSADQNDRNKAVLIPEHFMKGREDDRLRVELYPADSSAVTVDYDGTNTLFLVPVTAYQ